MVLAELEVRLKTIHPSVGAHPSSPSLPGGESGCLPSLFWSFFGSKPVFSSEGFILLVTERELTWARPPSTQGGGGVGGRGSLSHLSRCLHTQLTFGSHISLLLAQLL